MNKCLDRMIAVSLGAGGLPEAFVWKEQRIPVTEILDDWEEAGCWWLDEEPRRVYRVLSANGATYELHQLAASGWQLYRIFD